jgi:hypothetical protein
MTTTTVTTVRCDQCGKTVPKEQRDGWLFLNVMSKEAHRSRVDLTIAGLRWPAALSSDLCSWECVRDYAALQLLDPTPEQP